MLTEEQMHSTFDFAETMGRFINRDGILLLMDRYEDDNQVKNSFFVHGEDNNKHFLGEITFKDDTKNYENFIDYEVILSLKEKGWL